MMIAISSAPRRSFCQAGHWNITGVILEVIKNALAEALIAR